MTDLAAMPVRGSAAPAPKIATVRAPGGGRPPYGDARRLARCLACPDSAGPTDASQASVRLSALRHPFTGLREAKKQNPGAKTRRGNEKGCLKWWVMILTRAVALILRSAHARRLRKL